MEGNPTIGLQKAGERQLERVGGGREGYRIGEGAGGGGGSGGWGAHLARDKAILRARVEYGKGAEVN